MTKITKTDRERYSDLGNSRRLIKRYGKDLRYVPTWGCWLVWDTQRWRRDTLNKMMVFAKRTIRSLYAAAAEMEDDARRDGLVRI